MTTTVTDIDDAFWSVWREIKPQIQKALENANEYSIEDVLHWIATNEWKCWYSPHAVACGRIANYPNHRALVIVLAGGELEEIVRAEPQIVEFAKENGCKYVEIYGRKGWARALSGYEEQCTVLRKVLK